MKKPILVQDLINANIVTKTFKFLAGKKIHERLHSGEKAYKCQIL